MLALPWFVHTAQRQSGTYGLPVLYQDTDAYYEQMAAAEEAELQALAVSTDANLIQQVASDHRVRIAVGSPACTVDTSGFKDRAMRGGMHCHLNVVFDDGTTWIARLPRLNSRSPSRELEHAILLSEVAIYNILAESTALPVPRVHWYHLGQGGSPSFVLMDLMDGKDRFYDSINDAKYRSRIVDQVADQMIQLASVQFRMVGSPNISTTRQNVGPFVDPSLCRLASSQKLLQIGPYASIREFHLAHVQQVLEGIASGFQYIGHETTAYLVHLELLAIVKELYPLQQDWDKAPFYLKHVDDKGDQWLMDDECNITAFIDWERRVLCSHEHETA
jgi:hypothetical protein